MGWVQQWTPRPMLGSRQEGSQPTQPQGPFPRGLEPGRRLGLLELQRSAGHWKPGTLKGSPRLRSPDLSKAH